MADKVSAIDKLADAFAGEDVDMDGLTVAEAIEKLAGLVGGGSGSSAPTVSITLGMDYDEDGSYWYAQRKWVSEQDSAAFLEAVKSGTLPTLKVDLRKATIEAASSREVQSAGWTAANNAAKLYWGAWTESVVLLQPTKFIDSMTGQTADYQVVENLSVYYETNMIESSKLASAYTKIEVGKYGNGTYGTPQVTTESAKAFQS